MGDLTILYVSASKMPAGWRDYQIGCLKQACDGAPIISVTRAPLDLGTNISDDGPHSYWNIYMQMLRAAKLATTPFVAMAEDDTLYTREHFTEFRPQPHQVSYDRSRWSLFTWDNLYCMRQRISNCSLIAPTALLIEALEERKTAWPNGAPDEIIGEVGRETVDSRLRVTPRAMVEWYSNNPIVQLNHPTGTDTGASYRAANGRRMYKKHGQMKAYDIPHWGKATDIIGRYLA
jgi:hypothetical protein